jgi:hypothetical protein
MFVLFFASVETHDMLVPYEYERALLSYPDQTQV